MEVYDAAHMPIQAVRLAMEIAAGGRIQPLFRPQHNRAGGSYADQDTLDSASLYAMAPLDGEAWQEVAAGAMAIAAAAEFYLGVEMLFQEAMLQQRHVGNGVLEQVTRTPARDGVVAQVWFDLGDSNEILVTNKIMSGMIGPPTS